MTMLPMLVLLKKMSLIEDFLVMLRSYILIIFISASSLLVLFDMHSSEESALYFNEIFTSCVVAPCAK